MRSFFKSDPYSRPVFKIDAIYNPAGQNPYGSKIAAPIVSNMLSEILPYLGMASGNSDTTAAVTKNAKTVSIPEVTGKTLTEAKKTLENLGFKVINEETEKSNSILVQEQVPSKDTNVIEGATVVLYTEENSVRTSVNVPNLMGMTLSEAKSALAEKNLNFLYSGSGKVVSQSIKENETAEQGTIITLKLE